MGNGTAAPSDLERHWQLRLPRALHALYAVAEAPSLPQCDFLPIDRLISGEDRWFGMLPQFYPYATLGEGDLFGFYAPGAFSDQRQEDYPVLAWSHEYDHYSPVASGFESFLNWIITLSRFEAQDSTEDTGALEIIGRLEEQQRLHADVGLRNDISTTRPPRNEWELYGRLADMDPCSATVLAQLGCKHLARGDGERARDFFVRASESAPWFADPYFLLAECFRIRGDEAAAIDRWHQALLCPIALSTRTSEYDLGAKSPDLEIYEAAVDELIARCDQIPTEMRVTPLMRLTLEGDPYNAHEHLSLARELGALNDRAGEERELINALTLSTDDDLGRECYDRLIDLFQSQDRVREADLCVTDRER